MQPRPARQEDGFQLLRPHAAQHLEELITEFNREPNHGLRCWMLELIGDARSADALPVLATQLHSVGERIAYVGHGWSLWRETTPTTIR